MYNTMVIIGVIFTVIYFYYGIIKDPPVKDELEHYFDKDLKEMYDNQEGKSLPIEDLRLTSNSETDELDRVTLFLVLLSVIIVITIVIMVIYVTMMV